MHHKNVFDLGKLNVFNKNNDNYNTGNTLLTVIKQKNWLLVSNFKRIFAVKISLFIFNKIQNKYDNISILRTN